MVVFAGSIDDFVISSFLSTGAASETVPMKIYAGGRATATPALNALATIMLAFTLAAVALAALVMRRMRARQGGGVDARLDNLAAVG
jgi:spermidine/putrescine transport system permease protein